MAITYQPNPDADRDPGLRVGDVFAGMLAQLNIPAVDTIDRVEATVGDVLAERGFDDVEMAGLRDGRLLLRADAFTAKLLRVDLDQLHAALTARLDDEVSEIRVTCW